MFKTLKLYMLLLLTCFTIVFSQYDTQIKVLTYNIYARGHGNGPYDDIVEVLNDIDADISGLQEVDSCNNRNSLDVIKWLGEQTNTYFHFAPALKNWNGGQYGNGMLSIHEPDNIRKFWADLESYGAEDRSASEIEITMNGEVVRVLNTHVAYSGVQAPVIQAQQMVDWIDEGGDKTIPMIIMGDFNSTPGDAVMSIFEEEGFKYVRNDNGSVMDNIDHIMFRPENRWQVLDKGKPTQYTASDHYPVWAILRLEGNTFTSDISKNINSNHLFVKSLNRNQFLINIEKTGIYEISIISPKGQLIKSTEASLLNYNSNLVTFGDTEISSGIHIIKLKNSSNTFIFKTFIN